MINTDRQEMNMTTNMTPYLMTGPEHLAEFASLAHDASREPDPTRRLATATLAQAHATAAQALVFAALVASDAGDEFGAPWLDLIDPDGSQRASMAEREEQRAAERAEHEKRIADLRSELPSYNFGPLVPEQ